MPEPLNQPSEARPAEDVVSPVNGSSDIKEPSPAADPQREPSVSQPFEEQPPAEQPSEGQPSEQPPVEQKSVERPPVEDDTPMHDGSAPIPGSTPGAVKRQSSHDSHDDGEERAAKRVKEDHPVSLSNRHLIQL